MISARQLAFTVLRDIDKGAFADVALERNIGKFTLMPADRRLATELIYGTVRRQRTLDALIDQLGKRRADQQPADLRRILHVGFYQLRYLDHVPNHAVVDTTVQLAKQQRLGKLSGVVNGMLRQYTRLQEAKGDPLQLPTDEIAALGVLHSYPDWIIQAWQQLVPAADVARLCEWFNQAPKIDLRVNRLRTTVDQVSTALTDHGLTVVPHGGIPDALRIVGPMGNVRQLPGYEAGWWMVQDSSAQLVSYLVDPQPGETVIDACGAPGGKTTHLAEMMEDRGRVLGCDRTSSRLNKIRQNAKRLQLNSIETVMGDSREHPEFKGIADRVLLDVPCSGLGTLHRHADARWRQTPNSIAGLTTLQRELLEAAVDWVKPDGVLVYSTCTLHPDENQNLIQAFLSDHPDWQIDPPEDDSPVAPFVTNQGWAMVWPHKQDMDGFFMVRMRRIV
ncbi:16S rRNA (cytosine(967)-C(5))-methyltransferase [Leptolyngbyaceae cyanobacterium CCMR0082]|uniref:16S rRNA (cytosine(967)-C(5))-methyltransferase n=1 Tax=Adonisia turfae CCMR0082 TaxID=2304604 RepID=A0A6M0S403_9CYAN|nr:16S rRNA (cytosine(967)-C(5))-methyltransferase [Adonisia turfae]NEZ63096.1 16S rRNA (cytosine(967)-C(5))-methyltransferase [Adonisia turfae CCMR0082]